MDFLGQLEHITDKQALTEFVNSAEEGDEVIVIAFRKGEMAFGWLGNIDERAMIYGAEAFKNCVFNREDTICTDPDCKTCRSTR